MKIEISHLLEGSKKAKGVAVIIDVFRAFSVACYVYKNGAKFIIPVDDINLAYKLKNDNPDYILIGERKSKKQPGFDFGNSPTHLENFDFTNKVVVQTTSAGTQGLVSAKNADVVITGSFVNVNAIIRFIKKLNPEFVSLVCMGLELKEITQEDLLCAEFIKNELEGLPNNNKTSIIEQLINGSGKRFFNIENKEWSPEKDFYLCTDFGRFDFILQLEKLNDKFYFLNKINSDDR